MLKRGRRARGRRQEAESRPLTDRRRHIPSGKQEEGLGVWFRGRLGTDSGPGGGMCARGPPGGTESGGFAENPQNCGLFFSPLEPSRKPLEGVKPASGMVYFLFRKIAPATEWKGREGPREMGDQRSDCSGDREQGLWRGAGRAGGSGPSGACLFRREKGIRRRRPGGPQDRPHRRPTVRPPVGLCGRRPSVSPPDRPQLPSLLWPPVCRDESILIKVNHYLYASLGIMKHKRKGPCCACLPILQS